MKSFVFFGLLIVSTWGRVLAKDVAKEPASSDPQFELLRVQEFAGDLEFQKTRVGGLSGIVWEDGEKTLWAVSDDRGRVNEPRLYAFDLEIPKTPQMTTPLDLRLREKVDFKIKTEGLPAAKVKELEKRNAVLDFEGLSLLPWGNFLLVSEGDMNQKPRVQSRLLEIKKNGQYVRDYDLPPDYLAEKSGRQRKGPRNNFSFEGLAGADNRSAWVLALEQGLVQDANPKKQTTRFLEYSQSEAWVLRPAREWTYPLEEPKDLTVSEKNNSGFALRGVSEILHVRGNEWWVLERTARISLEGLVLSAQVYSVELDSNRELSKRLILSLDQLKEAGGHSLHQNYEAMTWGPLLPDGRRLLIVASDNNLEKKTPTQFLFIAVRLPPLKEGT